MIIILNLIKSFQKTWNSAVVSITDFIAYFTCKIFKKHIILGSLLAYVVLLKNYKDKKDFLLMWFIVKAIILKWGTLIPR